MKQIIMSEKTREIKLMKVISDEKELNFSPLVILEHERQLREVRRSIQEDAKRRKKFMEGNR